MTMADSMNLMDALRDAGVEEAIASSELAGDHPGSSQPSGNSGQLREDHGARLSRLVGEVAADPLQSPQHRRALREAAKGAIKEVVAKWIAMGADPEDVAFALEGARVECMALARAKGRQG